MEKYIAIILVITAFSAAAQVEDTVRHPIDIALDSCMRDADYNEEAIAHCLMEALKSWRAEAEKNYQMLYAVLNEPDRKRLEEARRQWQEYESTENVLARSLYSDKNKYPYGIVPISRAIDIAKSRAADLKEYYDLIGRR